MPNVTIKRTEDHKSPGYRQHKAKKAQKKAKARLAQQAAIDSQNAYLKVIIEAEIESLYSQIETCYRSNQSNDEKKMQYGDFLEQLQQQQEKASFDNHLPTTIQFHINLVKFYQATILRSAAFSQVNGYRNDWLYLSETCKKTVKYLQSNFEKVLANDKLGDFPYCFPLFVESLSLDEKNKQFSKFPQLLSDNKLFQDHLKKLNIIKDSIIANHSVILTVLDKEPQQGFIRNIVTSMLSWVIDTTPTIKKNSHNFLEAFSMSLKLCIEDYIDLLLHTLYDLYGDDLVNSKITSENFDTQEIADTLKLIKFFTKKEAKEGTLSENYQERQKTIQTQIVLLEQIESTIEIVRTINSTVDNIGLATPKSFTPVDLWRQNIINANEETIHLIELLHSSRSPFLSTPERKIIFSPEWVLDKKNVALKNHLKNLKDATKFVRQNIGSCKIQEKNPGKALNQIINLNCILKDIYNDYKFLLKKINNHTSDKNELKMNFLKSQTALIQLAHSMMNLLNNNQETLPDSFQWWQKKLESINSKKTKIESAIEAEADVSVEKIINMKPHHSNEKKKPLNYNNTTPTMSSNIVIEASPPSLVFEYTYSPPNFLGMAKRNKQHKEHPITTHNPKKSNVICEEIKIHPNNNAEVKDKIKFILLVEYETRFENSFGLEIREKFKQAVHSLWDLLWSRNEFCKAEIKYLFFSLRQDTYLIYPKTNEKKMNLFFENNKSKIHLYKVIEECAKEIYDEAQITNDPTTKMSLLGQARFMHDKAFFCSRHFLAKPEYNTWYENLLEKNHSIDSQIDELYSLLHSTDPTVHLQDAKNSMRLQNY